MTLCIDDPAPDFTARTTDGSIAFHELLGAGWALLCMPAEDFCPIHPTALGGLRDVQNELVARDCRTIGVSPTPIERLRRWLIDMENVAGRPIDYVVIEDSNREVARRLGVGLVAHGATRAGEIARERTGRTVHVIGPDKRIKAVVTFPLRKSRDFDEILRVLDSCQAAADDAITIDARRRSGDGFTILLPDEFEDEVLNYLRDRPASWWGLP